MKNQLKVYKRLKLGKKNSKPLTAAELRRYWLKHRTLIESRIHEFEKYGRKGGEKDVFTELAFCLFTPQSKAVSCQDAVKRLYDKGLLFSGKPISIAKVINIVRFRNNKARYLVEARNKFSKYGKIYLKKKMSEFKNAVELRNWLKDNIKGFGLKEASHFLRNIGRGKEIAILDRHILRNLKKLNVIKKIPGSISPKTYVQIEKKMKAFAKKVKIPLDHLDLLFWGKETGEIFK